MTESHKDRLSNVLKNIENTLVSNAEKDFNDSIININGSNAKRNHKYDPRDLDNQISNYKDLLDRLKFLFLEQEAKEKFLRMILEPTPKNVEKSDIVKATEKRDSIKSEVEKKNNQVEELTIKINELVQENVAKLGKIKEVESTITQKLKSLGEKKKQLINSQEKFESYKQNDTSLPKLQQLFEKIPSLSENVDKSLLNSIDGMQTLIDEHLSKIHKIQDQITNTEELLLNEQQRITIDKLKTDELMKQNEILTTQIESIKMNLNDEDSSNTPEKLRMKKDEEVLKIMMKVWLQISNISDFKFDDDDNKLRFKFKDFPETECLIAVDNKTHKVEKVNYSTLDDDILKNLVTNGNKTKDPLLYIVENLYKQLHD